MPVYGNLGCFHVLAIVNSAAMKIGVHVSFKLVFSFFSGYIPMSGITGSYGSSIFSFLKNFNYSFLQWVYHFTFLPTLYEGSLFSISLQTFWWQSFWQVWDDISLWLAVPSSCPFMPRGVKWFLLLQAPGFCTTVNFLPNLPTSLLIVPLLNYLKLSSLRVSSPRDNLRKNMEL